ncbi:hypothetical protein ACFSR7_36370 [Cohnella sp. GCM10020058]|uniref:hypothetical protein n=1 Tax=Cohnella sp. GCM10020058 TaxID=3317330 RepID=UPI003639227D
MTIPFDPFTAPQLISELAENIVRRVEKNDAEISRLDSEWNDLAHLVELTSYDAPEGWRILRKQKENRRARRRCKDENAVMRPLYEYLIKSDEQIMKELRRSGKEAGRVASNQKNRQYSPRTDMFTKEEFNGRIAGCVIDSKKKGEAGS